MYYNLNQGFSMQSTLIYTYDHEISINYIRQNRRNLFIIIIFLYSCSFALLSYDQSQYYNVFFEQQLNYYPQFEQFWYCPYFRHEVITF